MENKNEFKLNKNIVEAVENGGDGFIEVEDDVTRVYLYSCSANITKAGRIAVELLKKEAFNIPKTAKVYVSHPVSEVDTLEMIACQWVMENRPSDDGNDITAWLESIGHKDYEARIMYELFIRFCMWSAFKGVELNFLKSKPELKVVN